MNGLGSNVCEAVRILVLFSRREKEYVGGISVVSMKVETMVVNNNVDGTVSYFVDGGFFIT